MTGVETKILVSFAGGDNLIDLSDADFRTAAGKSEAECLTGTEFPGPADGAPRLVKGDGVTACQYGVWIELGQTRSQGI